MVDAFSLPRFSFHPVRKVMVRDEHKRPLHAQAKNKGEFLRDRLQLLLQRTLRDEMFAPPPVRNASHARSHAELTPIESLIGSSGRKYVCGMLSEVVEGRWYLEDLGGSVELDLANISAQTAGLITECCVVLASGRLEDGLFVVEELVFPTSESRAQTLQQFPQLDSFGLEIKGSDGPLGDALRVAEGLRNAVNDMVVVVSDLYLDKPQVMARLGEMLSGLEAACPPLFVFMGNFTSKPMPARPGDHKKLKSYFDALADLIAKFPALCKSSRFVFVPGPNDPGVGNVLPRPPLPQTFTAKIRSKVPMAEFTSNPGRVLFYNQEFVFFRDDLTQKMRRNCILPPAPGPDGQRLKDAEHLVRTLFDQAHLCPLPPITRPVYWNYDHALRLYPLPHVVFLGDTVDQFDYNWDGCLCVNPSSFAHDYSFVVYQPASMKVEFSRVDLPSEDGAARSDSDDEAAAEGERDEQEGRIDRGEDGDEDNDHNDTLPPPEPEYNPDLL